MIYRRLPALLALLGVLVIGCSGDGFNSLVDPSWWEVTEDDPALPLTRTDWHVSSMPAQLDDNYIRGRLLWHTPRDLVRIEDVWDREAAQGQGVLRTFRIILRPQHFTVDTVSVGNKLHFDTTFGLKSWAGVTCYLGDYGYYIHDTTQYFELRARAASGRMHLEFGRIDEDVNGDGWAASEDGIGTGARNGVCEEEEDVGLDMLRDQDESYYDPATNPDPNGDNWYFLNDGKCPLPPDQCENIDWDDESIRYEWLNGTEGNIDDPRAQGRPDAEALSGYGFNQINSYFSYVIDFESDSFRVPDSDWPHDVSEERRWWTYRIPIRDTAALDEMVDEDGTPDWTRITHSRVWFEDETTENDIWDTVEIADWRFLQTGIELGSGSGPVADSNMSFIRDYEFAAGRVFDLGYPGEFGSDDTVIDLLIYEEERDQSEWVTADLAVMMVDPRNPHIGLRERVAGVYVTQVDRSAYQWFNDAERNLHYVVFNSEKGRYRALGAWMKVKRAGTQDTVVIGDLSQTAYGDSLVLQLLRHNNPDHTQQSWQLMWRNCYAVPRGVALEDLNISVWKGLPGAEMSDSSRDYQEVGGITQSYLEILGLDQYNPYGQKYPDGRIDDRVEIYRPDWGLLFFPRREPFNSSISFVDAAGNETMPLADTVPDIYLYTGPQQQAVSRYFLRFVTYTP